jgi:hypothetical protein
MIVYHVHLNAVCCLAKYDQSIGNPGKFTNVTMWEQCTSDSEIFRSDKVYYTIVITDIAGTHITD